MMNLPKFAACIVSLLPTLAFAQSPEKRWRVTVEPSPLNAPCVQVGVDEYGKPYYFKHTTQNDSDFVLEIYTDRSGAINKLLHGRYAGKRGEAPAVICGMAGDQVRGNTTIQAGCSCDETALKMVRTNTAPYKLYCGHVVLLHGSATETSAGEAAWKGNYTYGRPIGTWYRPLTVNEFETRVYDADGKEYRQTRYLIDEYHDTLPQEEYSGHFGMKHGPYRLFRTNGTLRESGTCENDQLSAQTFFDEKGKWLRNEPIKPVPVPDSYTMQSVAAVAELRTDFEPLLAALNLLNLPAKAQFEVAFYLEVSATGQCIVVGETISKKKKVNAEQLQQIKAELQRQLKNVRPAEFNGKPVPSMLQVTLRY